MFYLITYDISDSKNRTKLSDILDTYGIRVNYSVYECRIDKTQLKKILYQIEELKLINPKYDSIRVYFIPKNSLEKSFELGNKEEPFEAINMFI